MNNKSSKINSIIKKMSSIVVAGLLAISSIGAAKAPVDNSPKTSNLTSPYTEQELKTPLTFTALTADSKVTLTKVGSPSWTGEYSTDDGVNWNTYALGTEISLTAIGATVSFRGNISSSFSSSDHLRFVMSGSISASGNINSMYRYDQTGTTPANDFSTLKTLDKSHCYYKLFDGCSALTDVSNLLLPATTLAGNCYNSMFYGCTSLIAAPELPATTIAMYCYRYMFEGCTNLTTAPELPATELANFCYSSMFNGCTSLTAIPTDLLPAETLVSSCYAQMFYGCTSLTTAPALPATTLALNCYAAMFQGCTNLTTASELPATALANSCYNSMFSGCTNLETVPALPATKLTSGCYNSMFSGCTNLEIHNEPSEGFAKELTLPATTATGAVTNMFKGTKEFYSTGEGTPDLTMKLTLYVAGGKYNPPAPIIGGIIIELPTTLDPNYDPTIKPEEPVVIKIKLLLTSDNLIYDDSNHTLYVGDLPDDVTYTITGELYYTNPGDYFIKADFIYDEDKYAPIESISKTFTIA